MISHVLFCYITVQLIRDCKSPLSQANLCVTVHKVSSQTVSTVLRFISSHLAPLGHCPVSQSFSLDVSLALSSNVFIKSVFSNPLS